MASSTYVVLLLALSGAFLSEAFQRCPTTDYEVWGQNCYLFKADLITFDNARAKCKESGGDLASVLSSNENGHLWNKMKRLLRWNQAYWIGMRKEALGKPYSWVDGSNGDYTNWAPGEPNDKDGTENCVEAYRNRGNWNDHRCDKLCQGYVCKARPVSSSRDQGERSSFRSRDTNGTVAEWKQYGNYEYFLSSLNGGASNSYYDGRKFCQNNGGDLASIADSSERNQITQWLGESNYDGGIWVGLNRLLGPAWRWSDGSNIGTLNWAPGYPKYDEFGTLCGYIESKDTEGKYKNSHCDNKNKGFICKRNRGSTAPVTDAPMPKVDGYCPTGYFDVGNNKCFKVVALAKDQGIMFRDAVSECRRGPGANPDIASIHGDKETAFITSRLQDPSGNGMWIGLYRNDHGGNWRWTDSSPRDYDNWAIGEPSGSVDHCSEVWTTPGPAGTWNNIDCHSQRGYICQTYKDSRNIIPTPNPTTPHQCQSGYRPYWYGCYKVFTTPVSWSSARSLCESDGANLISINSPAENGAMRSIALGLGNSLWTGLSDVDGTGQYKWTDNWMVFYTNWGKDQPTRKSGGGCVVLRPDGTWDDSVCNSFYPVVCKTTTAPPLTPPTIKDGHCPVGTRWEEYHENCYFFETNEHKTFADATRDCLMRASTASLVSIHNLQENEFIYQTLVKKGSSNSVWTGLYRSRIDQKFYWMDTTPVDYENWAPGEPNGDDNQEDCVEYYASGYKKMWNDFKCTNTRNYVCKAPKLPPTPTDAPVPGYCPEGWDALGHTCYYLMPDKLTTWSEALDVCKQVSDGRANLASVRNAYEDDFIYAKMRTKTHLPVDKNYWLGMSKKDKDSPYLWADGSKVVYTNWAPGEPNDKSGTENCVEVYIESGQWNDHACTEFVSYVCKMSKVPNEPQGLSSGALAGISIAAIIGIALLVVAVLFVLFKMAIIGDPVEKMKTGFSNPFYRQSDDSTA